MDNEGEGKEMVGSSKNPLPKMNPDYAALRGLPAESSADDVHCDRARCGT